MTIELMIFVTMMLGLWFAQVMLVRALERCAETVPVRTFLRVKGTTVLFVALVVMACAASARADEGVLSVSLPAMAKERLPLPRPEPPPREAPRLPQLVAVLPHRLRVCRSPTTAQDVSKGPRHLTLVPPAENSGRRFLRGVSWRILRTRRIP